MLTADFGAAKSLFSQIYYLHLCSHVMSNFGPNLADQNADLNSLIFVHSIWRHGARTPTTLMANDQRNNQTDRWQIGGLGELTTKGMGQMYRLGQWIRKRYDGFLSTNFGPFEFNAHSSDYNRTLMSASAVLAAIYPPKSEDRFLPELNWRPLPVHLADKRIISDGSECSIIVEEEKRIFTGTEAKQIEHENEQFLRFLSDKSGFPADTLPLKEIRYVFDPLICELENEVELPSWVNGSARAHIWELYDTASAFFFSTKLLVKMKAGILLSEIIGRMEKVVVGGIAVDQRMKLQIYSAHDTTVAGILAALGAKPTTFPRFASLVLIELHKNSSSNWVRLFYKNETDKDTLWEWEIAECGYPCTIANLKSARSEFLLDSSEDVCSDLSGKMLIRESIYMTLIMFLSLLSTLLALLLVTGSLRKRKFNRTTRYMNVNSATNENEENGCLLMGERKEEEAIEMQ